MNACGGSQINWRLAKKVNVFEKPSQSNWQSPRACDPVAWEDLSHNLIGLPELECCKKVLGFWSLALGFFFARYSKPLLETAKWREDKELRAKYQVQRTNYETK